MLAKVVAPIDDISLAIAEQTSAITEIAHQAELIVQLAEEPSVVMSNTAQAVRTVKQLVSVIQNAGGGFIV